LDVALGALAYAYVFPPLEAGVKDPLLRAYSDFIRDRKRKRLKKGRRFHLRNLIVKRRRKLPKKRK